MAVVTKRRSTTADGKKTSNRRTQPRTRKSTTAPMEAVVPEPVTEPVQLTEAPATVVTIVPDPGFAARVGPPPEPRPRPEQRRGIFFDVENTSRAQDIIHVLRHLMIDRVGIDTDFTAVGNWRVIGHETARLLAQTGASLVHSAPSTGVRDWSDLRIAVAAGVWLAAARPGDVVEIVSDDQAFDAVGDVATSLGVEFRRLSYRAISGAPAELPADEPSREPRGRRRRRGGRRGRRDAIPVAPPPVAEPVVAANGAGPEDEGHTAPHDELLAVARELLEGSQDRPISIDALSNALKARGFRRTPGSPRLITRLRRIKELEVSRSGAIRLVGAASAAADAPAEP